MDKKDAIILYELDKNARQPLSKIAKKANLSRESILYRTKKYFKKGIIRNYLTVVDMSKLGYTPHKIYVRLTNNLKQEEITNYLTNNPNIAWVASIDGKYTIAFAPITKNLIQLNNIIQEFKNQYWQYIHDIDTTSIIQSYHFYRNYLHKGITEKRIAWGGIPTEKELDETNKIILDELSKNSRTNSVEIANKLKLSADAIIQRIKQLQNQGIIEHYMIWANVNKLIGEYYKTLLTVKSMNKEKEQEIIEYCKKNPNIVYVVNCFGPWQYELDIEVKDSKQYRTIIQEFLQKFGDVIKDYTTLNIYEEHKYKFYDKKMK